MRGASQIPKSKFGEEGKEESGLVLLVKVPARC